MNGQPTQRGRKRLYLKQNEGETQLLACATVKVTAGVAEQCAQVALGHARMLVYDARRETAAPLCTNVSRSSPRSTLISPRTWRSPFLEVFEYNGDRVTCGYLVVQPCGIDCMVSSV